MNNGNDHVKEKPLDTAQLIRQYSPLLSESLSDDLEALSAQSNALRSARQAISRTLTVRHGEKPLRFIG